MKNSQMMENAMAMSTPQMVMTYHVRWMSPKYLHRKITSSVQAHRPVSQRSVRAHSQRRGELAASSITAYLDHVDATVVKNLNTEVWCAGSFCLPLVSCRIHAVSAKLSK